MAGNDGWIGKAPSYLIEKFDMLAEGYDAYGFLDRGNQMKVLKYLAVWKLPKPEAVEKYEEELAESANVIEKPNET